MKSWQNRFPGVPELGANQGNIVEVHGGASDGSTFFLSEHTLIVDSFDGVLTSPLDVGRREPEMFAYLTFLGKLNNSTASGSTTLVLDSEGLMHLFRSARKLWLDTPGPYRRK